MTRAVTQNESEPRVTGVNSKNWELADYEIEQIRKSFGSVKVFYPTLGDVDMAKMIDKESYAPLDALKKAVAARDEKAFGAQVDK